MEPKKRPILVMMVIVLALINILNFFVVTDITGRVAQGIASLCLDFPPVITAIADQTATVGSVFSYQVLGTDDDNNLTYYDNTSLFDISSAGLISFTPQATGISSVGITVEDNTGCVSSNSTEQFTLTISAAPAAEEAAAAAPSGEGGGGGEGAAPTVKKASFQLSEEILKIALKQNQRLEKKLKITNDGDKSLTMSITNPLSQILTIYPLTFTLAPREEKEIILTFNREMEALPNIYFSQIEIMGTAEEEYVKKSLTVAIEIESVEVNFDVSLDLAKKESFPGEELKATVTLFNLKEIYPLNVTLVYMLLNSDNELVYETEETITLQERVSFSKAISLAETMPDGQYLLVIKVPYGETLATASEIFTIKSPPSALEELATPVTERPYLVVAIIPLILVLVMVILVILYMVYKKVRSAKTKTVIKNKTVMQPNIILNENLSSLKRKMMLLKESHRRGFIKDDTYHKTRERLERLINQERGKE